MIFSPDDSTEKNIGILICVNAIKYRIGTCRLHTILARRLCGLGYYVMYFDPAGIGDSEGVFQEKDIQEHHIDIEKGKYKEDIEDAITKFQSFVSLDKIISIGLCGGAISVLIEARDDDRVSDLILLGIPVIQPDTEGNQDEKEFDEASTIVTEEQASMALSSMLVKVFSMATWKRAMRFEINWKNELRVMITSLAMIIKKMMKKFGKTGTRGDKDILLNDEPITDHPRYNILFQKSLGRVFAREGRVLFAFGDLDLITWQFKSEILDKALSAGNPYEHLYEAHILKNTNHVFTARESQIELFGIIESWLNERYVVAKTRSDSWSPF